jgi:cold shock CspA family protein
MGKSQETFSKKEREKKKQRKRQEKLEKKEARRDEASSSDPDDMIAYVDEFGNISDTPPDPTRRKKVKAEQILVSVPKDEEIEGAEVVNEGRVKFFNHDKGFGFIQQFETLEEFFFHISKTLEPIDEGDEVSFDLESGPRGLNAVQVKKLSSEEPPA